VAVVSPKPLASRVRSAILGSLAKPYAGSVVAAGIGLLALVLLTAGYIFGYDWARTWKVIGLSGTMMPPFFDLHIVTDNAGRCAGDSYPYLHAACDPWSYPYNYPPIWLLLGRLGVNGDHTTLLAMLFELPALGLFAFLFYGRAVRCGLIALPLVLSPSVVLGFERGNTDIAEWVLVCSAALMFSEHRRLRAMASLLLLLFAVAIKFLAIFCCTLAIRLRPASVIVSVLLVAFSLGYFYSLFEVLLKIRKITPVSPYISYGFSILFDRLEFLYGPRLDLDLTGLGRSWVPIAVITLVIFVAIALALVFGRRGRSLCRLDEGSAGIAFLFGAGIYCGSFLLLGTNFTYRLIFLLLCLPQLLDWSERRGDGHAGSRRLAYLLIASCFISMWLKFHPEKTLHVNQITDWILFGVFTFLIILNGRYAFESLTRRPRTQWFPS